MLWVDTPGRGLDKLRGSGHQDHNVLDTEGWTTQSARNRFSLADESGHGGKNTAAFIRVVCPSSTHTDWWVLSCDYPTWSDGQKQQMGLRVRLYITSDDISTYHYLEDILDTHKKRGYIRWTIIRPTAKLFPFYDGPSSAQLWNCFHAYCGMIILAGMTHMHVNSKLKKL